MHCLFPGAASSSQPSTAGLPIDARVPRYGLVALRLVLVVLALWALRRELAGVDARALLRHLGDYGWRHLALALGATASSFLALGVLERLALRYAGTRGVPRRTAMITAFVAHAVSQSVGFAALTGATVRQRAYQRYQLGAGMIARQSAFVIASVTLGLLASGAGALLESTAPVPLAGVPIPVRPLGALLAIAVAVYLAWCALSTRDIVGIGRWTFRRPSGRLALAQLATAATDWILTAAVLFAFLPSGTGIGAGELLRIYLLAQTVGMLSHVPGGAGVFEAAILTLAPPVPGGRTTLVAALVMFRVAYYLVPLLIALAVAASAELHRRRGRDRAGARDRGAAERGVARRMATTIGGIAPGREPADTQPPLPGTRTGTRVG